MRWYLEMQCETCGRLLWVVTGEAETHDEAAPDQARELQAAFNAYRVHHDMEHDGSNVGGRLRFGERYTSVESEAR